MITDCLYLQMAEKDTKHNLTPKTSLKTKNATEQAMEKLSGQLSCSLCLEEYCKPRVLPCLHVFCEACLEKLVNTQQCTLSQLS